MTVDSVQLTVMVSLRDEFKIFLFISVGNSLTVNCQLSTVNLHPLLTHYKKRIKTMTTYIYALGFFDGVHLGHQALLRAVKTLASEGCRGVVTFSGHPDTLVLGTTPALINTAEDRENLLRNYGMDRVVTLPFDKKMLSTPWEDFLEELRRDFGAGGFVCGEDFRFGAMGAGTASLLQDYCEKEGLPCAVVPEQEMSGVRISSTYIRELLTQGRMAEADTFLGHPHVLSGTVVSGRHLGRTLGIPTANLHLPEGVIVPRFGVYACRALAEGRAYPAVTNVGTRPTVGGHHITVEPWLLDYDGDLYGKKITLEFLDFLRPEQKFDSLEDLKAAILKNAEQTREIVKLKASPPGELAGRSPD